MSFFSDLFSGDFSNLGTDLVDAPSSFINHPADIAETIGGALALTGIGFGADALLGGGLFGADALAGGADAGLGLADASFADASGIAAGDIGAEVGADVGAGLGADVLGSGADLLSAGGADALALGADTGGSFGDFIAGAGLDAAPGGSAADVAASSASAIDPAAGAVGSAPGVTPGSYAWTAGDISGPGIGSDVMNAPGVASGWGAGGLTGQLGSVLSSPWTKLAVGAAPLGLALGMGQPSLGAASQQAQANAQALSAFGQQQLQAGTSGTLTPGQTAVIGKMQQDLTNQWRQTLFNQGVQNPEADTRWAQITAAIDTQVTAATQQMLQQDITNGLQALGSASTTLNQIAQMQMQADQNFANMLVNATKALGSIFAGNSGQTFRLTAA